MAFQQALPLWMVALGLASTPFGLAQTTTASLGGVVTDATGAVVPRAQVVVKNEATGDTRNSVSNGAGVFTFSALPTGDYDVTITAGGFRPFQQTAIHLDPNDQRSVRDIALQPGGANETVEVTTAANTINLDSGEQSSLISSQEIQHLSVEGRDVTELLKILPGFAISNGGAGSFSNTQYDPAQVNPTGALGQYAANGTPVNGQALLSDGVDITDPGAFGGALQNINYEQVAEVKVQTSSFTANTAHGPIVINAVTKSGSQQYHGSLYTFARTSQLNSVDWIANYTGQGKPPDRYVYPGFSFGGPLSIPGLPFNRSKKLTFFAGAEDYAQRNAYAYGSASNATLTALVPTTGMRTGDFSQGQLQQYLGSAYTVDPAGGPCAYNGSTTGSVPNSNICRVPVTAPNGTPVVNGNIGAYLDPLSKIILNEMPTPNIASNGTYNWITTNLIRNDLWQASGRVDYAANANNHIFGRYSIEKGVSGVPQNEYYSARGSLGGINLPGGGLLSTVSSHVGSIDYATIFGPTLTNEFYAAAAYYVQNFIAANQAAIANNPYQGVFNNGSKVQPTLEDYGNDGLPLLRTPDTSFGGIFARKQVRIAGDNLTKVLGQHTITGGLFYQWDDNPQVAPFVNTNGTINLYYFGETYTDPVKGTIHDTGPVGSGNGGNYLANFAEGSVFGYSQTNKAPEPNLFFWNLSGYAQDHWRATPRLTIDYGLRVEHITPWEDTHNLGIGVFSAAQYAADASPSGVAAGVALPGIRYHGIDSAIPNGGRPTRWGFLEPRFGFAWDASGTGNTIVRGGFGIYRAHDAYNDANNQNQTTLGERTASVSGPIQLSSISSQAQAGGPAAFNPDSNAYAFNPKDDEEPRVRTYNLSVDQKLPGDMLLEVAYVGNYSDRLLNDGSTQNTSLDDLNSLPIGSLFQAQPNTRPDTAKTAGTVYPVFTAPGATNSAGESGLSQSVIDTYKKYSYYNHLYVPTHNLFANYNGLQIGLTRQTGKAHFNVNYTFSKALGILGIGGSATYSYPADPFNLNNDYNSLPFDRRNIFNASYSYSFGDLVRNKWVGGFANGWELSGIDNYQSGPNLASVISSNYNLTGTLTVPVGAVAQVGSNSSTCATTTGTGSCSISISSQNILGTPDVNLQPRLVGAPNVVTQPHQYVNASAFTLPGLGSNGAYRYAFTPGPAFFDADLTAAKRIKVTEGSSIQLRLAAFNFINHANYSFTPVRSQNYTLNLSQSTNSTNVNQALLGTNAASNPDFGFAPLKQGRRILEVALRYDF